MVKVLILLLGVGDLAVSKFGAQSSLPYRIDVDKFEGAKNEKI